MSDIQVIFKWIYDKKSYDHLEEVLSNEEIDIDVSLSSGPIYMTLEIKLPEEAGIEETINLCEIFAVDSQDEIDAKLVSFHVEIT